MNCRLLPPDEQRKFYQEQLNQKSEVILQKKPRVIYETTQKFRLTTQLLKQRKKQ